MRRLLASRVCLIIYPFTATAEVPCRDIRTFDFRNHTFLAKTHTGASDYGLHNGPAPGGSLRLRNGVFPQWDLPLETYAPDWHTTIRHDLPLQASGIRLLVLEQDHLTGTGSFTYIFGFRCDAGSLQQIFEASGQGLKLERLTTNAMDISVALWAEGDPHCCPRRQVHLRYLWSPKHKRFLRQSSNAPCPWLP